MTPIHRLPAYLREPPSMGIYFALSLSLSHSLSFFLSIAAFYFRVFLSTVQTCVCVRICKVRIMPVDSSFARTNLWSPWSL
jgi:hypothetical protein